MFADALNSIFIRAWVALKREEGQTFVEYSLIAAFVGIALILGLTAFKGQISSALSSIGSQL
jgi:Flp pilus assembly pilin Flp